MITTNNSAAVRECPACGDSGIRPTGAELDVCICNAGKALIKGCLSGRSHPYASRPNAASHIWLTPPEIIRALGEFDLDPCGAPNPRPWPTARDHITLPADGLQAEWWGRVWCNPPFGQHTEAWLQRMAEHGNGIALAFARTETRMFHRWVWPHASAVLFLASRPHFHLPDGTRAKGNSGGPICLIAYGEGNAEALRRSGLKGAIVKDNSAGRGEG